MLHAVVPLIAYCYLDVPQSARGTCSNTRDCFAFEYSERLTSFFALKYSLVIVLLVIDPFCRDIFSMSTIITYFGVRNLVDVENKSSWITGPANSVSFNDVSLVVLIDAQTLLSTS